MDKKEIATQGDLFRVLDLLDKTGITYWLDGGWGVDALVGKQTRAHRDIDINFDSKHTEELLQMLQENGYAVVTNQNPVRIELYHPEFSYIDIHPFVLFDDGSAKQADFEGNWYEFEADYFGEAIFEGRRISCTSLNGQIVFHTGYALRDVDKHDIKNLEGLLHKREQAQG